MIPNGATLRKAVDVIAPISFMAEDADVKGDLFELLASDLGSQKKAAQFRTPRHLIRVITQMVDPQIGETVCDPACGTGGFLIAAYDHILLANTSPEFVREKLSPYGAPCASASATASPAPSGTFCRKAPYTALTATRTSCAWPP